MFQTEHSKPAETTKKQHLFCRKERKTHLITQFTAETVKFFPEHHFTGTLHGQHR
jgi:hypothetical protein